MSEKNTPVSHNDEIDLLQLFRSFGDFIVRIFSGFFNLILKILLFSLKKWVYLLLAVILGVIGSFLLTKTQESIYYSSLVLKSNAVPNQEMISYINRLENLTSRANYPILANLLGISREDAEKINAIQAYWFIDKNKDGIVDGSDMDNRFLADTNVNKVGWKFGIKAIVTDPAVFNKITSGIIYYVSSNNYFNRMNKLRLDNLKEIIMQTGKEVEKLDSLQKKEYYMLEDAARLREGQLVFTNDPEIQLFHEDLLTLVKDKQRSQKELTIHSEIISLLENFVITQKPTNNIMFYVRKLVPVFIGLAYLLALFITYRKRIVAEIRK